MSTWSSCDGHLVRDVSAYADEDGYPVVLVELGQP